MNEMREAVMACNVILAGGGVLLLVLMAARGAWLMPDVSPGACLRFYRDVMRQAIRRVKV